MFVAIFEVNAGAVKVANVVIESIPDRVSISDDPDEVSLIVDDRNTADLIPAHDRQCLGYQTQTAEEQANTKAERAILV